MSLKNIPFGSVKTFNVIVEISKGSQNKYEYDETQDVIKLDWVFHGGLKFPFDYGYIPQTRAGDGDCQDVFVLSSHPLSTNTVVECRAIGVLEQLDRGEEDNKILALPVADPEFKDINSLDDLSTEYKNLFREFYAGVAKQKNKIIEITGFGDRVKAEADLATAHQLFKNK